MAEQELEPVPVDDAPVVEVEVIVTGDAPRPDENIIVQNGSEASEEKGDDKEQKKRGNPIFLFRFARLPDVIFMLLGALAAVAHGAALPVLFLFFGDLINDFINEDISSRISQNLTATFNTSFTVNCSTVLPVGPGVNITIGSVISEITPQAECLLGDDFIARIDMVVYIFLGIAAAVWIGAYLQVGLLQASAERQVQKIRLAYYKAVLRQDIAWYDENPSGEVSSRVSDDIDKIYEGIGDKMAQFLQAFATFLAGFAVAFSQDWRLTLFILGFTPIIGVSAAVISVLTARFTSREQKEYAGAGAVAEEVLSSIRTVVAFGGEKHEIERYDGKLNEAKKLGARKGFSFGIIFGFIFFILFFMYGCAFWFGGYLIAEQGAMGGKILAVFFSALVGAFSIGRAGPDLESVLTAAGAAQEIYNTIDRVPPIDSSSEEGLKPDDKFEPTVQLKNVNFTYPSRPDVQVLKDVSLSVGVGQTLALVGPSGCGKSTVVQLIERFYDINSEGKDFFEADSGQILVGDHDIRELNVKWLRSQMGLVSQEPVLFDTTIAENIRFGKEDATLEEIQEAARNANAHDFISELPKGYDTPAGEGGTQLSGGQKQRIAIARALIANPKILLLDEATSALDSQSESIVQEALDRARSGRTTIVIAHRLSTIKGADKIVAMDKGSVIESGTHAELMTNKRLYHDLVTAQSFETDEIYIQSSSSPIKSASVIRMLSDSGSGVEFQRQGSLRRQGSVRRQISVSAKQEGIKKQVSVKDEEQWDKDLKDVSILRLISLNAKEWWIITFGVLASAIGGAIFPLFGLVFGDILRVFALPLDQIVQEISLFAGLFMVLGVVAGLGFFIKTLTFTVAGQNLTARLRAVSFKAMLRQEIGWFDEERNSTGALTTRLAHDAAQVQGATGQRIGTMIETMTGMLLALVIAFVYSWLLTIVILGLVPLLIIAGAIHTKAVTNRVSKNKKFIEGAGKIVVDSTSHIRTVASLTSEDRFYREYEHELSVPYKRLVYANPILYGFTYAFSQAMLYLMYAVVFRFGAFQINSDNPVIHEDFNDVFRTFIALVFGAFSIGQASAFAPNYVKAKLSAKRIFSLLDREPVIDNFDESGQKLDKVAGDLAVEGVRFTYPARPDVEVLKGIDLAVKPGQTLALVGPSGCGKSTVVQLIERFYDPSKGGLKLEGVDLRDLNLAWLRSQVGIVSQEPVLFDGSIAENIRYGALFREVSDEEVIAAAKSANIHSFIETLPMGYNTNVGGKGTQLSGGQKQRVAIARALLRDPKVLLLDEATSALDSESERIVQEALDKAREGRTCIVIAHRLSTIYNSDMIAVIKEGEVLETGTHAELLAKEGLYYKLNKYQTLAKATDSSDKQ